MKEKGPDKPNDNDGSLKDSGSLDQADLKAKTARPDEVNGTGEMSVVIENDEAFALNEEVDWSLTGIMNHPSGVDFALQQNLAMMEKQTKDLIENGSVEDLLKALDENNRQLELLKDRMGNSLGWLTNS